ncbi:MAG TPA: hypothetical protein VKD24_08275 [Candidatus Angelobacter sp.]|nr:hypothetical protein [Candidatus Angelobacter sp.]
MSTKNPLTYGFRAVGRDPALLLIEILWRWSFGALVLSLLWMVLISPAPAFLGSDCSGCGSRDPVTVARQLKFWLATGGHERLPLVVAFLVAGTALWTLLGAAGRTLTLNRLEPSGVRFGSIVALQSLRAVFVWLAGVSLAATFALDARLTGGDNPDLFLFSALGVWTVILIGVLWAVVNWHLSLAAICCAKNACGFARSIRQAVGLARSHSGDLIGVSMVFALWRLVTLAIAFVLCFLPSFTMRTAPRAYFAWSIVVVLGYLAASDLLHISRIAGYLVIDPVDSGDERPGTPLPRTSSNRQ